MPESGTVPPVCERAVRNPGCRRVHKLDRVTVRAVIFDIGGVLEKVGPPATWLGPWLQELSLAVDDMRKAMGDAAPAGQIRDRRSPSRNTGHGSPQRSA